MSCVGVSDGDVHQAATHKGELGSDQSSVRIFTPHFAGSISETWGPCLRSFTEIENSMLIVVVEGLCANTIHLPKWLLQTKICVCRGVREGSVLQKDKECVFDVVRRGRGRGCSLNHSTPSQARECKIECLSFHTTLCKQHPPHVGSLRTEFLRNREFNAHRRCAVAVG
jgi:bacterioferritin-associated ferredoxin